VVTTEEFKSTPLSQYDDSLWERNSMYDNMPFVWNSDLNVEKVFAKVTGNVIKASRCVIEKGKPYEIKH